MKMPNTTPDTMPPWSKGSGMARPSRPSGFTLIELMVAVALTGVLLVVALPSYRGMVRDNCLTAVTNEFVGLVQYARSEAAKRSSVIKLKRQGSAWNKKWQVKLGNETIREHIPSCEVEFRARIAATSVLFSPRGATPKLYRFSVCDDRQNETGRQIEITRSGRPRVSSRTCT